MTTTQLPFAVAPRRDGDPEPDILGMRLSHRALRRAMHRLTDAVREAALEPPSPVRTTAIVRYADRVLHEIHGHHTKEDEVLWPVIAASAGADADLAPLTDDHRALDPLLAAAGTALRAFATDPAGGAGALAAVFAELRDLLDEHIEDEERQLFPVILRYVSAGDFARCEAIFQKGTPPRHLAFVLPWMFSQCSPDERGEILRRAGMPLRVMLAVTAPGYARLERRAFGPAT